MFIFSCTRRASAWNKPWAVLCALAASTIVAGCGGGGGGGGGADTPPVVVAPAITTQPASQNVGIGAPATFSVVASGTAPISYQWKRDGNVIAGATSASYTLPAAQRDREPMDCHGQ